MKKANNEGFSLVEVLVAIVILAAIVIPACTSLVLSHRINAKTDALLRAQLAVSSAAETLMAEGVCSEYMLPDEIDNENDNNDENYGYEQIEVKENNETKLKLVDRFPVVLINVEKVKVSGDGAAASYHPYYKVEISSKEDPDISVTTMIRSVEVNQGGVTDEET